MFEKLPLTGKLSKPHWSGIYWATYQGGITKRWRIPDSMFGGTDNFKYEIHDKAAIKKLSRDELVKLSPAEKYDILVSDYNFSLTKMERKRTGVMTNKKMAKWWGLCHAWAPATLIYSPPKPITAQNRDGINIPFGASDIKALLTYNIHLQSPKSFFLGSRCNVTMPAILSALTFGLVSENHYLNLIKNQRCNDMNPGALHIALANLIGVRKEGFVMDMTRGKEVWNQGVYAYNSQILKKKKVKEGPVFRRRKFDPILGPDMIYKMETVVTYISEIHPNWDGNNYPSRSLQTKTYKYDLHVNKYGHIVGGDWNSSERPDFFWRYGDPGINPKVIGLDWLKEKAYGRTSQIKNKAHKFTKAQLRGKWRRAIKNVRLSNRFLKNTKELVNLRKSERADQYKELKTFYKTQYKKLMKK